MFLFGEKTGTKKAGKQLARGEAQIARENIETINRYRQSLIISNAIFIIVHVIFYFISGISTLSIVLFLLSCAASWGSWYFMYQIGSAKSGGSVTDLNMNGGLSEYSKDIVILSIAAQAGGLIYRHLMWIIFLIPIYAVYKIARLYFSSPLAQLRSANSASNDDETPANNRRGGKANVIRTARR